MRGAFPGWPSFASIGEAIVTDGEDGNGGVVRFIHLSLYYKFGSGASLRGPINHFLVEGRALFGIGGGRAPCCVRGGGTGAPL